MKIAILKDLHASGYRRDAWKAQFRECLAIAAGCHAIILAGDIFDSERIGDADASTGDVANDVIAGIQWARKQYPNLPEIHALVGNHDMPKGNALDALAVLEPVGVTVHRGICGSFRRDWGPVVGFLNWSWAESNAEAHVQELFDLQLHPGSLLVTHCDITGARMNNGKVADPGAKRWALSREFIAKISESVHVECAHYHGEQRISERAWIGPAMIQGNFGHADEPQGFVIFDTETRERRRVDVNEAAPHRKVFASTPESALAEAAMLTEDSGPTWIVTNGFELSQTDKATLAAAGIRSSAANLPVPTRVGRSVEIATDSRLTDPLEILGLYNAAQEEHLTVEEIGIRAALVNETLAGSQDVTPRIVAGAGSVTPILATLEGIGPYRSPVTIDFAAMGRVVAVVGATGIGKTTGIGSIFLALYNAIPGYNGSGYGMVTGTDGVGRVSLEFTFRGEAYRVERAFKTGARNTQTACLHMPDGEAIVGADAVDRKIKAMIGSADAALATCWISPDRDNDICGATTTDAGRRESFSQFLGFGWLDAVATLCGEAARESKAEESALAARIVGAGDVDSRLDELRESESTCKAAREQSGREWEAAKARFSAVEGEARGAEGDDEAHRAAIAEHDRITADIAEAEATALSVGTRRERAAQARLDAAQIENESLPELARLEAEDTELRERFEAYRKRAAWEREEREAERALADAEAKLRGATIALDPADEQEAARVEEWIGKGKERRAEIARVEKVNRESRDAAIRKESRIQSLRQDIARMERRVADRKPIPFGEKCEGSGCAYLAEAAGLPVQLAELKGALAEAEAVTTPDALDVPSIADIEAGYALANAAADRVEVAKRSEREAEAHRVEAGNARDRLDAIRLAEPDRVEDPSARLAAITPMIRELIGLRGRLDGLRAVAAEYDDLDAEAVRGAARLSALHTALLGSAVRANNARAALEDSAKAREAIALRVAESKAALTLAETELEAARENLSNATATLKRHEEFAAEIAGLRVQAEALALRVKRLEWARLAFGKKGVQPIIIDSTAAPALEARANALLLDVTGGAMELRIVTRELTDKGEIREVFRVEVRNGSAEFRDVGKFSGGERERVQVVFRAALARELAALVGAPCESIVIDEAFNKLSPGAIPPMVETLEALAAHFSQIIVLTPKPDTAAMFERSVVVVPGPTGEPAWPVNSQEVVW